MTEARWEHQQKAFDFVKERFARKQYGVMLAMVMGSGKSRPAVELAVDQQAEQLLIVCPLRVIPVWPKQFDRFAGTHYHVVALNEGSAERKMREAARYYAWSQTRHHPLALVVNYDAARRQPFATWAAAHPWDMVIADESHRLKEGRGKTSMWAAKLGLAARRRLALTGTPMPHQPTDIWAQFRFLDPHHLERSFAEFRSRYAVMGGYFDRQVVAWRDLDDLERRFRELAFRVDDSVLDLPPEMDEVRSTDMGNEGARIYDELEREMIAEVGRGAVTAANAMVKLLRLAQITGGTAPLESGDVCQIDHAKEELLIELLDDLREPVVVFCRFRADLEAVHRAASRAMHGSWELSGERDELANWQQGAEGADVLAVQIQAGGVGVDLTRARVAIYYSFGFSLADYLQSRARIRRPPQQRPCLFLHLQIRNSIDQYILRAVEARRDLVDSVLQELRTKGAVNVVAG